MFTASLASLDELYPPAGQLPPPGGMWVAQPGGLEHHRDDTSDLILSVNPNDTCFDDPDARPTGDRTTSLAPNTASGFADLDDRPTSDGMISEERKTNACFGELDGRPTKDRTTSMKEQVATHLEDTAEHPWDGTAHLADNDGHPWDGLTPRNNFDGSQTLHQTTDLRSYPLETGDLGLVPGGNIYASGMLGELFLEFDLNLQRMPQ